LIEGDTDEEEERINETGTYSFRIGPRTMAQEVVQGVGAELESLDLTDPSFIHASARRFIASNMTISIR
jgi:hypothetical protein